MEGRKSLVCVVGNLHHRWRIGFRGLLRKGLLPVLGERGKMMAHPQLGL